MCKNEYTKQEIINELSKLYALQAEGKRVRVLIQQYEQRLCEVCDSELDEEKAHAKNPKNGKARS